jgi:hypothetical protein
MAPGRQTSTFAFFVVGFVIALGLAACTSTQPRSIEASPRTIDALVAGVRVSAELTDSSLLATEAVADFGIEEGVRMVRVRILDGLDLDVRIETPDTLTLSGPPRVCLVGPYSAPDDAGLSDRCWGEPDLGALLAEQLPTDAAGHPMLVAGQPIVVSAALRRGDVRCDYPPGEWQLEVTLEPLVDGTSAGGIELVPTSVEVPSRAAGPLPLILFDTRYCGLATIVYRDQGEPPVATPP